MEGSYVGQRTDYSKNRKTVLFSGINMALWFEESRVMNAR